MRAQILALVGLVLGTTLVGCGADENGAAPVVKVSADQRALEANAKAESTTKWLEGMPAEKRQDAARTPQVVEALKGATDPTLKTRIAALGLPNVKP